MPGVRNQKQDDTSNHADGLPTLLAVLNAVLPGSMPGVIKNQLGNLKADTVFALVALAFGFIP